MDFAEVDVHHGHDVIGGGLEDAPHFEEVEVFVWSQETAFLAALLLRKRILRYFFVVCRHVGMSDRRAFHGR